MSSYRGFGPRPALMPFRDGTLDPALVTPEREAYAARLRRGYPGPPVQQNAQTGFVGITTDGRPIPGLFALRDTGLDSRPIVAAARDLLAVLDGDERARVLHARDSDRWRMWTNAFPSWSPHGLWLQGLTAPKRDAALAVIRATLSSQGYALTRDVMRLNGELGAFLGQYPDTLTEWAYWLSIFGSPSVGEPWGWQLYGHHLDLNCMIVDRQLVLTPAFMGAEFESDRLFGEERALALELVTSLSAGQADEAIVYRRFADLPHELQGPIDGRHVGGAGQDNRIVPYEGIAAGELTAPQRATLRRLLAAWHRRLTQGPARDRLREIERHLDETRFAWYGPRDDAHAFYYRVHSPVVMLEYDNHPGIFLDNDEPQPFHVHTIVRTPNGNDYGRDILRQHLATHRHDDGRAPGR